MGGSREGGGEDCDHFVNIYRVLQREKVDGRILGIARRRRIDWETSEGAEGVDGEVSDDIKAMSE